jgi:hypothetical protein
VNTSPPPEATKAPAALRRMFDRLIKQGLPAAMLAALSVRRGKHRSQRIRRNQPIAGNLYGMALVDAIANPGALETLRSSRGSQAMHRLARKARGAA